MNRQRLEHRGVGDRVRQGVAVWLIGLLVVLLLRPRGLLGREA